MIVYKIVRALVKAYLKVFNSWVIEGKENIPLNGPAILTANHSSNWDPPAVGCSIDRVVHFMAKEELFKIPLIGKIFNFLECFPVKRDSVDRSALRKSFAYLEQGEILGIFPEGRRNDAQELLPFQQGMALIAIKAGVPIIPIALSGTRTTFPATVRGKLVVKIGKPMYYPELYKRKVKSEEIEKVTAEVKGEIRKMLSQKV